MKSSAIKVNNSLRNLLLSQCETCVKTRTSCEYFGQRYQYKPVTKKEILAFIGDVRKITDIDKMIFGTASMEWPKEGSAINIPKSRNWTLYRLKRMFLTPLQFFYSNHSAELFIIFITIVSMIIIYFKLLK